MSRKKKSAEEKLVDLCQEVGIEVVKSHLRLIDLLWSEKDTGHTPVLTTPKARRAVSVRKPTIPDTGGQA